MFYINLKSQTEEKKNIKEQLIRDMIYVCCLPELSEKSRKEFLDKAISWPFSDKSTENINKSAKYKGCIYWSKNALEHYKKNNSSTGLRHEHIVPRAIFKEAMESYFSDIRKKISSSDDVDFNEVFNKLKEHMEKKIIGCVVTEDEATIIDGGTGKKAEFKKVMPACAYGSKPHKNAQDKFFNIENAWARYTQLNNKITIYRLKWHDSKRGWSPNPEILDYDYLSKVR